MAAKKTAKKTTRSRSTSKTTTRRADVTKEATSAETPTKVVAKRTRRVTTVVPEQRGNGITASCSATDRVAIMAFEIFEDRMRWGKPGTAEGDWLEAERRMHTSA